MWWEIVHVHVLNLHVADGTNLTYKLLNYVDKVFVLFIFFEYSIVLFVLLLIKC